MQSCKCAVQGCSTKLVGLVWVVACLEQSGEAIQVAVSDRFMQGVVAWGSCRQGHSYQNDQDWQN